jgi:hypothetical protein
MLFPSLRRFVALRPGRQKSCTLHARRGIDGVFLAADAGRFHGFVFFCDE